MSFSRTGEASFNTTPDELMAWVAKRVAPHKENTIYHIHRYHSGGQPPAKILRRVLIEKEEQQELQAR